MRTFRSALVLLGLTVSASCPLAGCGQGDGKAVAEVSPEYRAKTNDMLKQMAKDQMEKHKKPAKASR